MTVEELEIIINAQTKQFQKELKNVTNQVNTMEKKVTKSLNNIKNVFGRVGKMIAALGIGKILKDSIISAMDSIESDSMFDTVFGPMADEMRQWSMELQETLGLNGYAIRENAAVLYNMTRSMGLASKEALTLSKDMTLLAEDMASFYNLNSEEAFNKIRAGLTGETEPLKQLGILVDENTIKQYAYANGIARVGSELSNTEKVMARYGAIQQQAATASGDLARTLNSPANQLRILRNNLQLLMIELGRAFMPIVQVVLPILNSFVKALTTAASVVSRFMNALFGTKASSSAGSASASIQNMNTAIGGTSTGLDKVGSSAKKAGEEAKKAKGFLAGFDEINKLSPKADDTASSGGGAGTGGGIGDIPGIEIPDIDTGPMEETTGKIEEMALRLREIFSNIADFIKEHKEIIISLISGLVAGILSYFAITKWKVIKDAILVAIGWISSIPTALVGAFATLTSPAALVAIGIGAVVAAIVYLWQTSEEFRNSITTIVTGVMDVLKRLWNEILVPLGSFILDLLFTVLEPIAKFLAVTVVTAVEGVFKILESLWTNILKPIADFLLDVLSMALSAVIEIWEAWKPTLKKVGDNLVEIWNSILKPLVDWVVERFQKVFEETGKVLEKVFEFIKQVLKGVLDFIVGVFTGDWERAWDGIKTIFSTVFNAIKDIAINIWNNIKAYLSTTWNGIKDTASSVWNSMKDICVNVFNGIKSSIQEKIDAVKEVFNGIVTFVSGVFTGNWRKAWDGVKQIFSGIFNGLESIAKRPINAIIGAINTMIRGLNKIKLPDWVPGLGGKGINIPQIPKLARGGIVDQGTVFMAGEAGKEVVMPLESNTGWMDQVAGRIANSLNVGSAQQGGGDRPVQVILQVGNSELGRVVIDSINQLQRQSGKTLLEIY